MHVQAPHESERRLLTRREVAQQLALGQRTVARLIAAGDLQCVRIGRPVRVRPADLEQFIDRQAGGP